MIKLVTYADDLSAPAVSPERLRVLRWTGHQNILPQTNCLVSGRPVRRKNLRVRSVRFLGRVEAPTAGVAAPRLRGYGCALPVVAHAIPQAPAYGLPHPVEIGGQLSLAVSLYSTIVMATERSRPNVRELDAPSFACPGRGGPTVRPKLMRARSPFRRAARLVLADMEVPDRRKRFSGPADIPTPVQRTSSATNGDRR
jgi:hypothetical protein